MQASDFFQKILFLFTLGFVILSASCRTDSGSVSQKTQYTEHGSGELGAQAFRVVDCLLPGQIRRLGQHATYVTARRPIRTTVEDCVVRGGEYVEFDRADYTTALDVWLDLAKGGDPEAQYYVATIHEKGHQGRPNYQQAAQWYQRAAEQGFRRAAINLGRLYEQGLGVTKNPAESFAWYARASGLDTTQLSTLVTEEEIEPVQDLSSPPPQPETDVERREEAREETVLSHETNPPTIEILDPPVVRTRGMKIERGRLSLAMPVGAQHIITGRVRAPSGLRTLTVNETALEADPQGIFTIHAPILESNEDKIPFGYLGR